MLNRRDFLKTAAAAALAASGLAHRSAAAPARRPNILFFFIDDLGWKDIACAGGDFYETPNTDRLASEGVMFTQNYSGAGNCAPSRACLISGQYSPRHGVYAVGTTDRGPVNKMRLVPIPNNPALAPENVTVAEALKAAGYATACFGKWHLGGGASDPSKQGFDEARDFPPEAYSQKDDPRAAYAITDAACRFMEKNRERPFFLYVSHHAVHVAYYARKEILEKFKAKKPGEHNDALFAGLIWHMDDAVGIALKKLKELGLDENTVVFFAGDNGATPNSPQSPLRGSKGGYYEGGIRVPLIVRWPGVVKPATTCPVPTINLDLYPTFLELAGSAPPDGKVLDGESIAGLLRGGAALKRESIFWHFPGYLDGANSGSRDRDFRTRPVTAMRKGPWKMLLYHEEWVLDGGRAKVDTNNAVELYNLEDDPGERQNLAGERKDKRDELLNEMLAWIERTQAKLPTQPNPEYNPSAPAAAGTVNRLPGLGKGKGKGKGQGKGKKKA